MPVPHDTEQAPMDGVDGARLKQLREAAGWDAKVLAIRVSLSREQVEQIETGGHDLFYNVSIKRACARKLALALGADPHSVVSPLATDPSPIPHMSGPAVVPTWQAPELDGMRPERWNGPLTAMWVSAGLALTLMVLGVTLGRWGDGAPPPWHQWRMGWETWQQRTWGLISADSPPALPQAQHQPPAPPAPQTAVVPAENNGSPEPPHQPLTLANTPLSDTGLACPLASDDSPVVQPLKAFKPGQMVFVQAVGDAHLCLRDHSGQVWSVNFKAGQERSFQGAPPWSVQSPSLAQFNVFFQGWKLRLPTDTTQSVQIVELQR